MAIAQDTIVTVGSGATAKSFGVSKTLDQYTLDDLKTVGDWAYSAYNDNVYNANIFHEVWYNNPLINISDNESAIRLTAMPDNQLLTEGYNLQSEGVFVRNVLVYNEYFDDVDWSHEYIGIGNSNLSRYRIVTDIELQDLKISIDDTDINVYNTTYTTCKLGINDVMICPIQLIILEDNTVLFNMALPFNGGRGTAGNINSWLTYKLWDYNDPVIKNYGMASSSTDLLLRNISGVNNPAYYLAPNSINYELQNGFQNKTFTDESSLVKCESYEWGGYRFFKYNLNQSNLDAPYIWHAYAGVKFELDGVTYKPIVSNGMITGYTSDMTEESEWDEWENIKDHVTPSVRPTPTPPSGDDFDDHAMGAGTGISGMANLWLLTASQLSDLHSACSSAPVGFDPLNSFISVMGIATNPEYLTHEIQYITPINIRMSDGTTWQTHVEGHIVDSQVSAFSFTNIRVQRKYNNFLDFSPYATHEIFVPMCGWITLPDIAVDRSITVTYIPDIESLKCRAVVSVVDNSGNKCVIGEKDGIMGADVPFTNVGHSLFVGDAIVNGADVAGEAITMAIGAGFTKTNAKGGTYRPYEGFTLGGSGTLPGAIGNALVSGNLNRTHFMTGNGTRIGFSDGENIQIKSVYHNVDIPPNYPHTVGLMCNKTGELSEFTGFTVCDNPHITFSALEAEKEEIKRLLEEGVIL